MPGVRCLPMEYERFIDEAVKLGMRSGLAALSPLQRQVFLISEAEISCDMDGIDSFVGSHEPAILLEASEAFSAVGASAIAAGLKEIAQASPSADGGLLGRVNKLICNRSGYNAESIARYIASHT
jgi:hypothetical protein